jgi:hypothetical protein
MICHAHFLTSKMLHTAACTPPANLPSRQLSHFWRCTAHLRCCVPLLPSCAIPSLDPLQTDASKLTNRTRDLSVTTHNPRNYFLLSANSCWGGSLRPEALGHAGYCPLGFDAVHSDRCLPLFQRSSRYMHTFFRNEDKYLPDYTASYPRRQCRREFRALQRGALAYESSHDPRMRILQISVD